MDYTELTSTSQSWDEDGVSSRVNSEGGSPSCPAWPETEACGHPHLMDLCSIMKHAMCYLLFTEKVHSS